MSKKIKLAAPPRPTIYVRGNETMVEIGPGVAVNLAAAKRRGLVPEDFDGNRSE